MSDWENSDYYHPRTNAEHFCMSRNKFSKTKLDWTIKNFKRLLNLNSELTLQSPHFEAKHGCVSTTGKWHVELIIKPLYMDETRIGLYFVRSNCQLTAFGRLVACIVDKDKKLQKQADWLVDMDFIDSGKDMFVYKSELDDALLPNGDLSLRCFVAMIHYDITEPSRKLDSGRMRGFSKLLKEPEFSDAVLECGDRMFQVHKCVLFARSSKFRELFTENEEDNIVKVKDMETDVLENLLYYIYSDKIHYESCSIDLAKQLLTAADMYCLSELRELCVKLLEKNLCVHNLLEVSHVADFHNLELLKELCIKVMIKNGRQIIFSNDAYLYFKYAPRFLLDGVLKQLFDQRLPVLNLALPEPCSFPLVQDNEALKNFKFPPSASNLLNVEEHAIVKENHSTIIHPTPSIASPGSLTTTIKFGISDNKHQTTTEEKSSTDPSRSIELSGGLQTNKFKAIQSVQPTTSIGSPGWTSSPQYFGFHSASNTIQPSVITQPVTTCSSGALNLDGVPNKKPPFPSFQPISTSTFGCRPAFNESQSCQPSTASSLPFGSVDQQTVDNVNTQSAQK